MKKMYIPEKRKKEINYKRKYRILYVESLLLLCALLAVVYINFDYMLFKVLISENYVYTDTLDQIYEEEVGVKANTAGYLRYFDKLAIALITEKIADTNGDVYTHMKTKDQYARLDAYKKAESKQCALTDMGQGTVYVKIPNMSAYTRKFVQKNKNKLKTYQNMIIDLRGNPGGFLDDSYKIAELFLDKGQVIGYEDARQGIFTKKVVAKRKPAFTFAHIVLLEDEHTASAAETLITALKENLQNVTIVGTKSFGKGIGQIEFRLKDGYSAQATVLKLETPQGHSIHKKGIDPDNVYTKEDIIQYAKTLIEGAK